MVVSCGRRMFCIIKHVAQMTRDLSTNEDRIGEVHMANISPAVSKLRCSFSSI